MATVVPKLDRLTAIDGSGNHNPTPTREYILSIVVFHRRIIDRQLTNENTVNERVVFVRNFYSGTPAISGGDVQLETRVTTPPRLFQDLKQDLELRSGDWVLLSARRAYLPQPNPPWDPIVNIHRWYRVANVDEAPSPNGSTWVRDVTLVGPDWDWQSNITLRTQNNIPLTTQVTIVRGVVAVFEKTIQLETSSLWTY